MARKVPKPKTVSEAKQNLRTRSAAIDHFGLIKKFPLQSVGVAFLSGMVWNGVRKKVSLPPGLMNVLLQVVKRF